MIDILFTKIPYPSNVFLTNFNDEEEYDFFTKKELDKIVSYFNNSHFKYIRSRYGHSSEMVGNPFDSIDYKYWIAPISVIDISSLPIPILSSGFSIHKNLDEWFYLYDKKVMKCYKCDTIDGVFQCLESIKAISRLDLDLL